jgi:hypothetical protein
MDEQQSILHVLSFLITPKVHFFHSPQCQQYSIYFLETFEIAKKYLDWDMSHLQVFSVMQENLGYGRLAQKLPRSTNTGALLDLLLGEKGKYVPIRSLEKVLGYSAATFQRAFEGKSQDDSLLYIK